jgi:hypothetical protein
MLLEQRLDFVSGSLATGNFDAVHGAGGDVDHFLEFRMIKHLNRLRKGLVLEGGKMQCKIVIETYLVSRY